MIIEDGVLKKIEEKDVINGIVNIPEGVIEIGSLLIDNEARLKSTFDLGGLEDLKEQNDKENVFPKNIKIIIISKTVTKIDKMAFMGLDGIESIEFQEGIELQEIGANAFNGCASLKGIELPETVKLIDVDAFRGCSSIESLTFPKESTVIFSDSSFSSCNDLNELYFLGRAKKCDDDKESGINLIAKNAEDVTIFNQHTIGSLRRKLKALAIPEGVKKIEDWTFNECYSIIKIIIPDSLEIIGNCAFSSCINLKDIKIAKNVTIIGEHAFDECKSIEKIIIPSSVEKISKSAFVNCIKLKELNIFEGVKEIEAYAFYGCFELKNVCLPESLERIGFEAFHLCLEMLEAKMSKNTRYIYNTFDNNCKIIKYEPQKSQSTEDDGR